MSDNNTNSGGSDNSGILRPDDWKNSPKIPAPGQQATGKRLQCMCCHTFASPPTIVKPNTVYLFGFVLTMIDCNGHPLPIGQALCSNCMGILINLVREKKDMPPLVFEGHLLDEEQVSPAEEPNNANPESENVEGESNADQPQDPPV